MPFRDAYRELGTAIEEGNYTATRAVEHTHLGSIGNLGLQKIKDKMNKLR